MNAPQHSQPGGSSNPVTQTTHRPAMARAMAFVQLMRTRAAWLVLFVGLAQLTLPEGYRPSDLIGMFYGAIERAEILTKRDSNIDFERDKAKAVAREQAKVQWEMEVLRQQMQTLHESMTAQSDIANGADWLCVIGRMVTANATNSDWHNAGQAMSGACGFSDQVRAEQQRRYAEMARKYAALVARSDELGG